MVICFGAGKSITQQTLVHLRRGSREKSEWSRREGLGAMGQFPIYSNKTLSKFINTSF